MDVNEHRVRVFGMSVCGAASCQYNSTSSNSEIGACDFKSESPRRRHGQKSHPAWSRRLKCRPVRESCIERAGFSSACDVRCRWEAARTDETTAQRKAYKMLQNSQKIEKKSSPVPHSFFGQARPTIWWASSGLRGMSAHAGNWGSHTADAGAGLRRALLLL